MNSEYIQDETYILSGGVIKLEYLFFDYLKTKQDAEILKRFLITQLHRFKNADEMTDYIKGEYPYYVSEGKDFCSEILHEIAKQNGKQYISQVENYSWIIEYINHILDKDFSIICNQNLKTKKRKYMDREAFYNKYK